MQMRHSHRLLVLCVLSFVHATPQAASMFPVAVDSFSQQVLVGMQLSTKQGERKGTSSKAENECVQALAPSSFHSSVETLVRASFSPEELATLEEFFSTPVGKKYVRFNVLQIYLAVGEKAPEALPSFSSAETKSIQAFAVTRAGDKLFVKQAMQSQAARQAYGVRIRELLEQCGGK